jgi:5-hydroxyisourate hydrolase-like protein (transthyretin family)
MSLPVLVTSAAALILFTQSPALPASRSAENVPPPPCSVSGHVVAATDGTPLKSSHVALLPEHASRDSHVYAAISDSSGRFIIKDVPAGRYRFLATHTGYVDKPYHSTGDDTGAVLALHAGDELKDMLFRMTPAAVITGRVSDEDGEPTALIQVVALRRPTDEEIDDREGLPSGTRDLQPAGMAQTDDRGQYRIFGLKPGEYYIKAVDQYEPMFHMIISSDWELHDALGSQYAPVYYPGVTQMSQAEAVPVTPGEEAHMDFVMRRIKTVEISGLVIGTDGKPATDVYLYLEELPAANYGAFHGSQIDAKGKFKVKGVAPGSYMLHAQQHSSDESNRHATQKIEVGSDNIDSITLALGRGVNLSGRVEVSGTGTVPFERLFLSLSSHEDQTANAWARVKKNGTFQLLDVPDGTFVFSLNGLDEGWYLKSVRLGADDLLAKGVAVEKGEGGGTIQVVVSNDGADLTGSVTQEDKPVIGARVRITPDPESSYNHLRSRTANTDQAGRFSFVGVAPGQYRVIAKVPSPDGGTVVVSDAKNVGLSERDHKTIELTVASPETH